MTIHVVTVYTQMTEGAIVLRAFACPVHAACVAEHWRRQLSYQGDADLVFCHPVTVEE